MIEVVKCYACPVAASRLLYECSLESRTQTRKEVLKLIIDLSSSVGVKGSEQGLLM